MSQRAKERSSRAKAANPGKPDVWVLLISGVDEQNGGGEGPGALTVAPEKCESFVVIVGSARGGKSTLKAAFLKLKDRPKPTVGLDYTFGRRTSATSPVKDVAHVWEVGGSAQTDLAQLPLTADRLNRAVVVVVADLSKPGNVVPTLRRWLDAMRSHTERTMEQLRRSDPAAAEECHRRAHGGISADHPDASRIDPLPLRLVIAATHLDALEDQPLALQDLLMNTLRYAAHMHNAWLVCTKEANASSLKNFADAATCVAFGAGRRRERNLDPGKPLNIPPGSDTLAKIGGPPGATPESLITSPWARRWDIWQDAVRQHCQPQPEEDDVAGAGEEEGDVGFAEAQVDRARARKDAELEQYRVEAERRRQLEVRERGSAGF